MQNPLSLRNLMVFLCILVYISLPAQNGVTISTSAEQNKLISAYRFILEQSNDDYRASGASDNQLFPEFGEFSIYRILSGSEKGSFVFPDQLPEDYSNISANSYSNYDWQSTPHVSIQFKKHPKRIAIFKSVNKSYRTAISWEAVYFERLFSEFLMDGIYYTIDENTLADQGLDPNTELFIIPSFVVNDSSETFIIDSLFSAYHGLKEKTDEYLSRGGNIYAEGNAAYFIEKLGYLEHGAIDYPGGTDDEGLISVDLDNDADILSLGSDAANSKIYGTGFPNINTSDISVIASESSGVPILFKLNSDITSGGKIHCNTGLPTVYGLSHPDATSQQISWTLNSILSAFSSEIDVTRKIKNELLYGQQIGDNTISYDRVDTFEVDLKIRNLCNTEVTLDATENIKNYFTFLDVISGPTPTIDGNRISFNGLTINAHSELVITYRVVTPAPDNSIHENVDDYLEHGTLIAVAVNQTRYSKSGFITNFQKWKSYADILFSARIFADTDVNWKNFLGLYYQPFKVFMIMENKSRSAAENTKYIQYVPKDVPFYWSDNS